MSRAALAAGTWCGVCGELVDQWHADRPEDEENPVAEPCGHTFADVLLELLRAQKRRAFFVS